MFDIRENLKKLPDSPGVYIHKDKLGQVIYVGKAISLRNRVRQYFQSSKNLDPKVRAMVSHIAEFEYISCATEMEAFILENNLIKKYMPKYNILLRDDKTYPYIKVTTKEQYPRIIKTREIKNDGNKYFGPYSDVKAVNEIVELLNEMFALKRCSLQKFPEDMRPCLNYHIKSCKGICASTVDREEYLAEIDMAIDILNGKNKKVIAELSAKMQEKSEALEFEEAAKYRDRIESFKAIAQTQRVTLVGVKDMDLILAVRGAKEHYAVIFFVREGKLSGRESFSMQATHSDDSAEIIAEFIKQYYVGIPNIPAEIIVDIIPKDRDLLEEFLSKISGRNIKIFVPQKGDKRALLDLAIKDAIEMGKSIDEKHTAQRERQKNLSDELFEIIKNSYPSFEKKTEYRAEAYDISNTNGIDTVGGMVVFEGTRPIRKDYRRFKIRTVTGPDDYLALKEVIERRFRRAIAKDPAFTKLPDILLIDGGKGQIGAVRESLLALEKDEGVRLDIPIIGMAKDDHHRTRAAVLFSGDDFEEVELLGKGLVFKYMGTVQEEVHRFAIDYHRNLRGKKVIGSILDNIEGIGPKKRNALLAHFKSVDNIKKATISELCEAEGITEKNAETIKKFFN